MLRCCVGFIDIFRGCGTGDAEHGRALGRALRCVLVLRTARLAAVACVLGAAVGTCPRGPVRASSAAATQLRRYAILPKFLPPATKPLQKFGDVVTQLRVRGTCRRDAKMLREFTGFEPVEWIQWGTRYDVVFEPTAARMQSERASTAPCTHFYGKKQRNDSFELLNIHYWHRKIDRHKFGAGLRSLRSAKRCPRWPAAASGSRGACRLPGGSTSHAMHATHDGATRRPPARP